MQTLALTVLLALSSWLGVRPFPEASGVWTVEKAWEEQNGVRVFSAFTDNVAALCATHSHIQFPGIIHGTHEVFADSSTIISYGDPTFQRVRTFYGSPSLKCSQVANTRRLEWRVHSYSVYFSRFGYFPRGSDSTNTEIFTESLHIVGAGSLLIMFVFTLVLFWGNVPHGLTLSVALSNLFFSAYFFGTISGYFGLPWSMLTAHKIADLGVWFGMVLLFNGLRIHGLIPKRLFVAYLFNVAMACAIIITGTSGDIVQLGTTTPFPATLGLMFLSVYVAGKRIVAFGWNAKDVFEFLSLSLFATFCLNDILSVTGLLGNLPAAPVGFIGGLSFFALSVNAQIRATYRERDYLRNNLELEVKKKTDELTNKTHALETAMKTLKETQGELVQSAKLASLGTLAAGIAHEINNSLNYVYGSLKPLERLASEIEKTELRDRMMKFVKLMNEGLRLTFDIIKSLKSHAGINQAKYSTIQVSELMHSVLTILRSKFRDRVEIKMEVPDDLVVFGNTVGLHQVFTNLITNALDAIADQGTVVLHAQKDDTGVAIRITDSGAGIPDNVKDRIFEPFFTTKETGKGTGLGLYIIKTEIDRHKGTIEVESQVGKGTTFTVRLPAVGAAEREAA